MKGQLRKTYAKIIKIGTDRKKRQEKTWGFLFSWMSTQCSVLSMLYIKNCEKQFSSRYTWETRNSASADKPRDAFVQILKHLRPHMCYHAEIGRSRTSCAGIGRGEPQNWGCYVYAWLQCAEEVVWYVAENLIEIRHNFLSYPASQWNIPSTVATNTPTNTLDRINP